MKGGPDRGVYLFVTRHVDDDLAIPGQEIGFGALQRAQALGDIEVLLERGRRVLHVELADELEPGLARLVAVVRSGPPLAFRRLSRIGCLLSRTRFDRRR